MTDDRNSRHNNQDAPPNQHEAARRAALVKLGLGVGIAYFAPTLTKLDRSAQAQGPSCAKNPRFCT